MAKLSERKLLKLVREHLDAEALLAAHPEVSRADLETLWRRLGLEPQPSRQRERELFDEPSPGSSQGRELKLLARCDGAARGNPGPAAVGAVLEDEEGDPLLEVSEQIGRATNNEAEYTAVIRAIEKALLLGATELVLCLDSELLVQQLRGNYKVKSPNLRPLHARATALLGRLRRWEARYVPRDENVAADRLANEAFRNPHA
ncbi:MAG: ribonuclease HI family protein [Candidatus Brocadiia bacterium]